MNIQAALFDFLDAAGPALGALGHLARTMFIFFSLRIFPFRFTKRHQGALLVLAGLLCGAAIYVIDHAISLLGSIPIPMSYFRISLIVVAVTVPTAMILYKGDQTLIALTTLLLYNVYSASRFVCLGLFSRGFPQASLISLIRLSTVAVAVISIVLCVFITQLQKTAVSGITRREGIFWFLVAFLAMVIMCVQTEQIRDWKQNVMSAIGLMLTNGAIYSLIFMYSKQKFIAIEQRMILYNMDKYEGYLEQMKELDTHISMMRHEVKNHIFYIDQLLKSGNYTVLQEYVDKLKADNIDSAKVVSTGNTVVDVIVNQKCAYAQSLGIGIQVAAALQETLRIDELSLCSVLGNLLNNAIEGSAGVENARISLDIRTFKGYLVVTARNFVSTNVIKDNPHLLTTKKDAENHGFGLKAVEQVANRYEGSLRLEMADQHTFSASVMMKNVPPSKPGEY